MPFDSSALPDGFHRFAWDGFSMEVPDDWNLSDYRMDRRMCSVRMEDDTSVRLDLDYLRSPRPIDADAVLKRCAGMTGALDKAGAHTTPLADMPEGWSAWLHAMPDKRILATAFRPGRGLAVFMRIHFEAASRRECERLVRRVASGFAEQGGGVALWSVYDGAIELSPDYRLAETSFQAGRKCMVFHWHLRRLFFWFFSLADVALRDKALEAWCAEFLNKHKDLQGRRFEPDAPGRLRAVRLKRHVLGHMDEIGRLCFRYRIECRRVPAKNQILLALFHHRGAGDLKRLALRFPDAGETEVAPAEPEGQ